MAQNLSGRQMVKYDQTKSDPICKWRTATVYTVVELVKFLPKKRMKKQDFRNYMGSFYGGAYFRTPYQLALQLGLYYEDEKELTGKSVNNLRLLCEGFWSFKNFILGLFCFCGPCNTFLFIFYFL